MCSADGLERLTCSFITGVTFPLSIFMIQILFTIYPLNDGHSMSIPGIYLILLLLTRASFQLNQNLRTH